MRKPLSLESGDTTERRKRVLQLWDEILSNILTETYMDKVINAESKEFRQFTFGMTGRKAQLLTAFQWLASMKT